LRTGGLSFDQCNGLEYGSLSRSGLCLDKILEANVLPSCGKIYPVVPTC